ncbi:MAG TPA: nuclear transport factor 2 family protein [Chthoniobacterales bacterium]|jgi:ketosteroid isomerase-like protein|nr:nuclear transport factor 2 family protein [Chthoniobacterales bacterium]
MKRLVLFTLIVLNLPLAVTHAAEAPDAPELTKLLNEFLAGASKNDIAMHDRFWAEELVYTSALGRRKGKADIMRELREESGKAPAASPTPDEGTTIYTAEDVRIQQYGDTAIVAFRLVATTDKAGTKTVANYFNTGTFLKRNAKWQVVGWQATALPKDSAPGK